VRRVEAGDTYTQVVSSTSVLSSLSRDDYFMRVTSNQTESLSSLALLAHFESVSERRHCRASSAQETIKWANCGASL
jgi:hypothetical protein